MKELVRELKAEGVLKTPAVVEAFLKNDRKMFVPEELQDEAYLDVPLPIGEGQTISQPYTVAFMMELLGPEQGQKILDIGFGSAWTTGILASIVGEEGRVYGLEIVPELFAFGKNNLKKFRYKNIKLYHQSGWEGLPEEAPFDRILVSAAASEVPQALKEQLKTGGRMVIPVGSSIKLIKRIDENKFEEEDYPGFAFVPLVK